MVGEPNLTEAVEVCRDYFVPHAIRDAPHAPRAASGVTAALCRPSSAFLVGLLTRPPPARPCLP